MQISEGHAQRSAVHQRALAAGVCVSRVLHVDDNLTLIEYSGARGCYAFFETIPGCYRIPLNIDEAARIWPDEEIPLLMARCGIVLTG